MTQFKPVNANDLAKEPGFALGMAFVSPPSLEIWADGIATSVPPRVMQVLVCLARQREQVVSRNDLIDECWQGRAVSEDAINRCIAQVRKLGEIGKFAVDTIPRVGYRLTEPHGRITDARSAEGSPNSSRKLSLALAIVGLLAIAIAGFFYSRSVRWEKQDHPRYVVESVTTTTDSKEAQARAQRITLAIAEALTGSGLDVIRIGPFDVEHGEKTVYVLSGTLDPTGSADHVTIRLDDRTRGRALLVRGYDGEPGKTDGLADRIATDLAHTLAWATRILALPENPEISERAVQVEGLLLDSKLQQGIAAARSLVAAAPSSGIANATLAEATIRASHALPVEERLPAFRTAQKALARAHRTLPNWGDLYWMDCVFDTSITHAGCERRMLEGLRLDPDNPTMLYAIGYWMLNFGRAEDALPYFAAAHRSDPNYELVAASYYFVLKMRSRDTDAEALKKLIFRKWPNSPEMKWWELTAALSGAEPDKGEAYLDAGIIDLYPRRADDERPVRLIARALRSRDAGDLGRARLACRTAYVSFAVAACINGLSQLRALDDVFDLMEARYRPRGPDPMPEQREKDLIDGGFASYDNLYMMFDGARNLRTDPRFTDFAKRAGFIRYWNETSPPDFCSAETVPVCELISD